VSLFVTWNDSQRSRSLARVAGLRRIVLAGRATGVHRHVLGSIQTFRLLGSERPAVVWYQYSVALGVVLALYAKWSGASVVADVHTKALHRTLGGVRGAVLASVKRWALRSCAAVLVASDQNATYARERFGVDPLVLGDPLPHPRPATGPDEPACDVVFVCSFACDEPLDLIREAATRLSGCYSVAITGDASSLSAPARRRLSMVAQLTGFLPDPEYWSLLRHARCVAVLTTEPGCVPCGAYEAIAIGRRPVLLDDPAVRAVFRDEAVYVRAQLDALVGAITDETDAGRPRADLAASYEARWQRRWARVGDRLVERRLVRSA
jgi:hypothetical protein